MNCTICGKRAYSEYCVQHKPRKPVKVNNPLPLPTKPINRNGATKKKWLSTRSAWLKANQPDYKGCYTCHYCGKSVDYTIITLDHLIPRSRAPELRYELSNLVPCCSSCNRLKGSVAHDEYLHTCYTQTIKIGL